MRFLKRKDKVKITIMLRGREVTHPESGQQLLARLAEELKDLAIVEQRPNLDGRNMTMMLGPSKAILSGQLEGGDAQTTDEVAAIDADAADGSGTGGAAATPANGATGAGAAEVTPSAAAAPAGDVAEAPVDSDA